MNFFLDHLKIFYQALLALWLDFWFGYNQFMDICLPSLAIISIIFRLIAIMVVINSQLLSLYFAFYIFYFACFFITECFKKYFTVSICYIFILVSISISLSIVFWLHLLSSFFHFKTFPSFFFYKNVYEYLFDQHSANDSIALYNG